MCEDAMMMYASQKYSFYKIKKVHMHTITINSDMLLHAVIPEFRRLRQEDSGSLRPTWAT